MAGKHRRAVAKHKAKVTRHAKGKRLAHHPRKLHPKATAGKHGHHGSTHPAAHHVATAGKHA